jgi:hypothetical protein
MAPRLLYNCTEIIENWHPLAEAPGPEYVRTHWSGPHVGKRLVEAFRTLSRMPVPRGPHNDMQGYWPEWVREWSDELARLTGDERQQAADARIANRVTIRPSAAEISRMEAAIGWPFMAQSGAGARADRPKDAARRACPAPTESYCSQSNRRWTASRPRAGTVGSSSSTLAARWSSTASRCGPPDSRSSVAANRRIRACRHRSKPSAWCR